MNNFFIYLVELNISLMILYVAYKIFFEKDRNFMIRRIYLLGVAVMPLILPLMPSSLRMPVSDMAPVSITLEGITIFSTGPEQVASGSMSFMNILFLVYLAIFSLGLIKLILQLARILRAAITSRRFEAGGTTLLASPTLHASSFFGYIFIDPARTEDESFPLILEHEGIHKREWHSVDRILVELFVMINWFNPVAWMFRKSVIQNLEFLADSAVLRKGTDPMKYQLSILNQYIGSASISNQFSSQIKNRINMLNKDYKLGSKWKLFLLIPLVTIAFYLVSCSEKGDMVAANDIEQVVTESEIITIDKIPSFKEQDPLAREEVFYIVEEMPKFEGGEPAQEFRRYIAKNLLYPEEAKENGITGRIIISFIVTSNGKVVIPNAQDMASISHTNLDEVVVVAYRTIEEGAPEPEEKYIKMLREEVIRVISESPDWTPGKQRGTAVNVMYTFPVNFILH
ncbi:MAG: hypothetical protein KAT15_07045 [Bacteroidales bacterium]|nr:hypothetical protein [Bacteroidales bacterium]